MWTLEIDVAWDSEAEVRALALAHSVALEVIERVGPAGGNPLCRATAGTRESLRAFLLAVYQDGTMADDEMAEAWCGDPRDEVAVGGD